MRSQCIMETHKDVYKSLFCSNDIVVSYPFSVNVSGTQRIDDDDQKFKQYIPLRMYVGIRKISGKDAEISYLKEYDHIQEQFIPQNSEYIYYDKEFIGKIGELVAGQGISISIVSELPLHYGVRNQEFICDAILTTCRVLIHGNGTQQDGSDSINEVIPLLPSDLVILYSGSPAIDMNHRLKSQSMHQDSLSPIIYERQGLAIDKFAINNYEIEDVYQFIKNIYLVSILHEDRSQSNGIKYELNKSLIDILHAVWGGTNVNEGMQCIIAPMHYLKSKIGDITNVAQKYGGCVLYYSGTDGFERKGVIVEYFSESVNYAGIAGGIYVKNPR